MKNIKWPSRPPISVESPVLVLGGKENSLSIVRHLGAMGVEVSCSGGLNNWGMFSSYCTHRHPVPARQKPGEYWSELLLGPQSPIEPGTILLACSDEALEFIADYHEALKPHFVYDEASPQQRHNMLDKLRTLEIARDIGVGAPRFWRVDSNAELDGILSEVNFPVMVKPLDSFSFSRTFGCKLFIVKSGFAEIIEKVHMAWDKGHPVMVVEMVPGPDSLLSSYYTYITDEGRYLFDFTKCIIRRFPVNRGGATYHKTTWMPETAEAGKKFFDGAGFLGLGNIEFKRDMRDGKLKLIEVNARFTAAQELAVKSGMPIDVITYCHLSGQPIPVVNSYQENLHFWYPLRDTLASLQLWYQDELTTKEWLTSLRLTDFVSPLHSIVDLKPSLFAGYDSFKEILSGRLGGVK